jgi:hypothetical protein
MFASWNHGVSAGKARIETSIALLSFAGMGIAASCSNLKSVNIGLQHTIANMHQLRRAMCFEGCGGAVVHFTVNVQSKFAVSDSGCGCVQVLRCSDGARLYCRQQAPVHLTNCAALPLTLQAASLQPTRADATLQEQFDHPFDILINIRGRIIEN